MRYSRTGARVCVSDRKGELMGKIDEWKSDRDRLNELLEESKKICKDFGIDLTEDKPPHFHFGGYSGIVRFKASSLWENVATTLMDDGYSVTLWYETEGGEKYVVIEYREV